jgi:iron complex outermembrane recepter protein
MKTRYLVSRAPLWSALALLVPAVQAQEATHGDAASSDDEATLQEIVVTGSLIKRTNTETPSPVQVITEQDLKQSGYTTVSDVLRNLSANGASTLSQSFSGAFASGGAGVSLRGLTVGGTLTLIDGHRMVGYPLTDDGERNFVDITAIPFSAVERIEVLKDGASAEYGSDALAGVVNIILRKEFKGAQIDVEGGTSTHGDGDMIHADGIWGFGDLASDGFNAYVTAEYRQQGEILLNHRNGFFTNGDWTNQGGVNTYPGAPNEFNSNLPGSVTGYLINPTPGNGAPDEAFLPGCTLALQTANRCLFDNQQQIQPRTQSESILAKVTNNLGENWQLISNASIFETKAQQVAGFNTTNYVNGGYTIVSFPPEGVPTPHIYPVTTLPAGYPGNPYGAAAPLQYSFPELGPETTDTKTDTYRLLEDLNGKVGGWELGLTAGIMYSHLRADFYNYLDPGAFQTAVDNGYILGSGGDAAAAFAPAAQAVDTSQLTLFSAHGQHPLYKLWGGDLTLALGAEWYESRLNALAPQSSVLGTQNMNNAWAKGSQADTAGFAELSIPLFKQLEINAAGRYDQYNTSAGGDFTPKIGMKFTPIEQVALRGTWGRGFRAPSVGETNSGLAFAAGSIPDPLLCGDGSPTTVGNFPSQCNVPLAGVQASNPNLKPEKTQNWTLGLILQPIQQVSLSVDYYNIKIEQDIISAFEAGGLGIAAGGLVRGPTANLQQVQPDGSLAFATTPTGIIVYQSYPYINASQDETNGLDFDLRGKFPLGAVGNLSAEVTWTHVMTYKLEALGVDYELAGTHGPSGTSGDTGNPKDRGTVSLTWDRGPISVTANVNYISSFSVTDPSTGAYTCEDAVYGSLDPRFPTGNAFPQSYCTVHSFTDVDLYAHYDINKYLSVHGSIVNAFNTPPPLDVQTYGSTGANGYFAAYDPAMHQTGAIGRYFTAGFSLHL